MRDPTVGETVNRAARLLRQLADQRLAPFGPWGGLHPGKTPMGGGPGLGAKARTERAGIEQPTMAATLGRMERDGIITREPDPADRRSARFSLTPAIREQTPQLLAAIRGLNAEAVASLSPADVDPLWPLLPKVTASIETALEGRDG